MTTPPRKRSKSYVPEPAYPEAMTPLTTKTRTTRRRKDWTDVVVTDADRCFVIAAGAGIERITYDQPDNAETEDVERQCIAFAAMCAAIHRPNDTLKRLWISQLFRQFNPDGTAP